MCIRDSQIIENGIRNKLSEVWGVEATLAYSGHRGFAGAADLIGVYEGHETILDFKQSNKPRKDEWNEDSYYLQLAGYSLCHNKTYGTNIDQGVILLCTKDLMFQRFVVDSERLKKLYLGRLIKAHNLLQALTRVNRPFNEFEYGYVIDFADIQKEFEKTNRLVIEYSSMTSSAEIAKVLDLIVLGSFDIISLAGCSKKL